MASDQLNWIKDDFENITEAWEGDLWNRRRLGEQLTNYVDRLQCGAVLALDAHWGEGKTWFVRHWNKHLEDEKHNVIYLDAFANDYLDDPFLMIAAEISQAFRNSNEIDNSDVKDFDSKTASVLISLAAAIPMIVAKAGMHWIGVGGAGEIIQEVYNQGKDVFDVASDEIASKVKEQIEKKIENHHIEKQTIQDFKVELAELADKLEKPLVFIIDELDRCRPDFAIRLIERIKHFFDIQNIVFILVMNKKQLSQSIKKYYGYDSELNGDYFEKFIDFTIEFPHIDQHKLYEEIIKEQLYRIGEIPSRNNCTELFFWILNFQLNKEYNSRELIRKINQYAILRTNNLKLNFILIALIFDESFEISISHLNKIINDFFNYFNGSDNEQMTKAYFVEQKICQQTHTQNSVICEIYNSVHKIEEYFTTIGQQSQKAHALKNLLSQYCIGKLKNYKDFKDIWKQYIKTGLFEIEE